jgi:hypothetical protein
MSKFEDTLLEELEECCSDLGAETRLEEGAPGQVGGTLKAALPASENGDRMLMEIRMLRYNEDVLYLQYYTTVVADIPDAAELKRAVPGMNFFCMLGNYGVYEPAKQLYHKYGLLLEEQLPTEILTARAIITLGALYRTLTDVFPVVMGLSHGIITLEEAEGKGLLRKEPG